MCADSSADTTSKNSCTCHIYHLYTVVYICLPGQVAMPIFIAMSLASIGYSLTPHVSNWMEWHDLPKQGPKKGASWWYLSQQDSFWVQKSDIF